MDQDMIDAAIDEAVERAMRTEMKWGLDDCSLWACSVPLAVTGVDLAAPFRGYACRFGAARALKRYAGGGLVEAAIKVAAANGLEQACRPFRGNLIGIVMSPARPALALFHRRGWIARSEDGVVSLPASAGIIAWRWS